MPSDGIVDLKPIIENLLKRFDEDEEVEKELDALWLALGICKRDWTKPTKVAK